MVTDASISFLDPRNHRQKTSMATTHAEEGQSDIESHGRKFSQRIVLGLIRNQGIGVPWTMKNRLTTYLTNMTRKTITVTNNSDDDN